MTEQNQSGQIATSEDLRSITEQVRRATKWSPDRYDHARGQRIIRLADALDALHATPELKEAMAMTGSALTLQHTPSGRPGKYVRLSRERVETLLSALRHLLPAIPEGR